MKKYLKKCLKGEEKLWKVFWIFYIFGGFIVSSVATLAIFQFLIAPIMEITVNDLNLYVLIKYFPGLFIGISIGLFCIVYEVVILISLWKCSWNCKNRIWGYLARGFVFVTFLFAIVDAIFEL